MTRSVLWHVICCENRYWRGMGILWHTRLCRRLAVARRAHGITGTPRRKARTKRTDDGMPVHSFQTMLKDLATICKNRVRFVDTTTVTEMLTRPTPLQQRAFDLLGVTLKM